MLRSAAAACRTLRCTASPRGKPALASMQESHSIIEQGLALVGAKRAPTRGSCGFRY